MSDTLELEEITAPSGTLLDVEVASEAELHAYAAALVDADDEAFLAATQDARRVFEAVTQVRLYAAMVELLAAPDAAVDAEDDLLAGCPLWPVATCADLSALAATAHETRAER